MLFLYACDLYFEGNTTLHLERISAFPLIFKLSCLRFVSFVRKLVLSLVQHVEKLSRDFVPPTYDIRPATEHHIS
jgi:hypothetical protein